MTGRLLRTFWVSDTFALSNNRPTPISPTTENSPTETEVAESVTTGVVFSPTEDLPSEEALIAPLSCWMKWVSPSLSITFGDYLTFFPPFVKAHSVATHPVEAGWFAHRIHFNYPLEQFRAHTAWSHIVAKMRTEGRFWDNTVFTYIFARGDGTPIGKITLAKAVTSEAEYCPPITTFWALQEFLLPTYFLLQQGVQWPTRTSVDGFYEELHCPELRHWALNSVTPNGTPVGLFAAPAWQAARRLRIVRQMDSSLDLAWVHTNSYECFSGDTQFILNFQALVGYPLLNTGTSIWEALTMLGGLISCILGRDINNMLQMEDARVPISPPREDRPLPGTPLQ